MPQFLCRVGTTGGEIAIRKVLAASGMAARENLTAEGFEVFSVASRAGVVRFVDRAANSPLGVFLRLLTRPIGVRDLESPSRLLLFGIGQRGGRRLRTPHLLLVIQELAALVAAGLPLLRCLDILRSRRSSTLAGSLLDRVRRNVAHGDSLSGAFRAEVGRVGLPELFVASVEIGEASGDLESSLRRYAAHLERVQSLRSKVRAALLYPTALAVVSIAVLTILVTVVIPRFSSFYANYDAELPRLTQLLVSLANAVGAYGALGVAVLTLIAVAAVGWLRTSAGRRWLDLMSVKLPVVGGLRRRYLDLEFVRTLGTLLRGGAPLVPALEVTTEGTSNSAYRARIEAVREQVSEGSSLNAALEDQGLLDPMGLEMVQVGESTGALEEMLDHVARAHDEVLDRQLTAAVGLLEPAVLVTMGLMVAAILLSLYLPLFQTVQVVR